MKKYTATLSLLETEKFITDFSQLAIFPKSTIINEPGDKPGFRKITLTINASPEELQLAIEGAPDLADLSSRGVDFLKAQGWFKKAKEAA